MTLAGPRLNADPTIPRVAHLPTHQIVLDPWNNLRACGRQFQYCIYLNFEVLLITSLS
jgi:hypothetical protein